MRFGTSLRRGAYKQRLSCGGHLCPAARSFATGWPAFADTGRPQRAVECKFPIRRPRRPSPGARRGITGAFYGFVATPTSGQDKPLSVTRIRGPGGASSPVSAKPGRRGAVSRLNAPPPLRSAIVSMTVAPTPRRSCRYGRRDLSRLHARSPRHAGRMISHKRPSGCQSNRTSPPL
jgi:hypothetical protein